jgi:O-antigen/teichoic acid export membrane protein
LALKRFNIESIWLAKFTALLYPFLITPVILREYGLWGAGVFVLVNQVSSYINMLDFGVTNGVARYIRKFKAGNEVGPTPTEYVATCFAGLSFAALAILLVLAFSFLLVDVYSIWTLQDNVLFHACLVASVLTAFSLPLRVGGAHFVGHNKYYLLMSVEAAFTGLKIALVLYAAIYSDIGLVGVTALIFSIGLLVVTANFYLALRYDSNFRIRWSNVKRSNYRKIVSMSSASAFISLSAMVVFHLPVVLLSTRSGLKEIIFLSYPVMIMLVASQFYSAYQMTLTPVATQYSLRRDWLDMKELLILSVKKYYITSFIGIALFVAIGDILLRAWLPANVADYQIDHLYHNTLILMMTQALYGSGYLMASILIGAGDLKKYAVFELFVTILASSIYLTYTFLCVPDVAGFVSLMVFVLLAKYFVALPLFLKQNYAIGFLDYLETCLCIHRSMKFKKEEG